MISYSGSSQSSSSSSSISGWSAASSVQTAPLRQHHVPLDTCAKCARTAEKMGICGGCKKIHYCNTTCQKKDWGRHKVDCIKSKEQKDKETKKNPSMSPISDGSVGATNTLVSELQSIKPTFKSPIFENYEVNVRTNEQGLANVQKALATWKLIGEGFIGTSAMCNLDLVSEMPKIKYIFIIDPSKLVGLFWKNMTLLIAKSTNRKECRRQIQDHLKDHMKSYLPLRHQGDSVKLAAKFSEAMNMECCWLSNRRRYDKIKEIVKNNSPIWLPLNYTDVAACKQIKEVWEKHRLQIGAAYISNIHDFIYPNDFAAYATSLKTLLCKNSIVIDTHDRRFVTTQKLSRLFTDGNLGTQIAFPHHFWRAPQIVPTLRVGRYLGSIETLYPIIRLQKTCQNSGDLFYEYGIEKRYYARQQAEGIEKGVDEQCSEDGDRYEVAKQTVSRFYRG